jgi:hypothetical protein
MPLQYSPVGPPITTGYAGFFLWAADSGTRRSILQKGGFTTPNASGLRGGPAANPWRQAGFGSPGP